MTWGRWNRSHRVTSFMSLKSARSKEEECGFPSSTLLLETSGSGTFYTYTVLHTFSKAVGPEVVRNRKYLLKMRVPDLIDDLSIALSHIQRAHFSVAIHARLTAYGNLLLNGVLDLTLSLRTTPLKET